MNPVLLLGGLKSYLPIRASSYRGTGGSTSGRYCYSVWLRHLSLIAVHTGMTRPRVVVELGPGDSIGLGLAALLSGVDSYIGLDVLEHASVDANSRVFEELIELYRHRAAIPADQDFPRLFPKLASYEYRSSLINEETLAERLSPAYLDCIRSCLHSRPLASDQISYYCPWNAASVEPNSAELVISQVALQVMENTQRKDDLRTSFSAMSRWLRPGGVMSHQIDFTSPGGEQWNHHWAYGDLSWAIVRGKRPYYQNRAALSDYLRLCEDVGCRVVEIERVKLVGLSRSEVAARFRHLPDDDFTTSAALIVAVKR